MSKAEKAHEPFDYRVKTFDKKGRVASNNPYRLVIENGVKKLERPPHSGYWYDEGGALLSSPEMAKEKEAAAAKAEAEQKAKEKADAEAKAKAEADAKSRNGGR